jgi:folate-dependent tRNA-U54 methylase TrmFO/GidA
MNVNFGLFPPLPAKPRVKGKDRKQAMSERALADLAVWLEKKNLAENQV